MKFGLVLLAMYAALSCVSCSAVRCGHRPTVSGAGGYCAEELAEGGKCVEESVFGGKCRVKLTFDSSGNLVDVDTDPPCFKGKAVSGLFVISGSSVSGEPLVENTGSITFGTGTTRCYGPPIPNPPICICTKAPCP